MDELIKYITEEKEHLPKRQRAFCEYILRNPLKGSILSITDMAKEARVGTATVVRTINALGYQSVNRFKSELRQCSFSLPIPTYNAFWSATQQSLLVTENGDVASILNLFADYVRNLNSPAFIEQLNTAAQMILKARRVFILGLRSSRVFSTLLENELQLLDIPYVQLSEHVDFIFDKLSDITQDDMLFTIAAAPVAMQSASVLQVCHEMGVPSVLLTLSQTDALSKYASCVIDMECFGMSTIYSPMVLCIELIRILLRRQLSEQSDLRSQRQDRFFKQHGLKIWDSDT